MKSKKSWKITIAAFGIGICLGWAPLAAYAQSQELPACQTAGDKDGDGVLDLVDSDEVDSCTASSTGLEDCLTGAGDGLLDCQ